MAFAACRSALTLLLLAAATDCVCQIDVRGIVKDASSGIPIPGAIIRLDSTNLRDTSDANGEFRISDGSTSIPPSRPVFDPAGSGAARIRIFRLASAGMVSEYAVPQTSGRQAWPIPRLPAGVYLLEARSAESVTSQRLISLGRDAAAAASLPFRTDASWRPALAKAGAAKKSLGGSKPGYFPRRLALDTLVKDGLIVALRRLGSFDGLWIGKTESQDTMMMAIEGDSLIYMRGPDFPPSDSCPSRGTNQVPSLFLPLPASGHIDNDSLAGKIPVEIPGVPVRFDLTAGFASDSTAAGHMDIRMDWRFESPNGPICAGALNTAWTAVKYGFDTTFDGTWKGMNSLGDSLRFTVHKGRVLTVAVEYDLGSTLESPPCGNRGGNETKGIPYWIFPDRKFSIAQSHLYKSDSSVFAYRIDGLFTGAESASGSGSFELSKSPLHFPPCDIREFFSWEATRTP